MSNNWPFLVVWSVVYGGKSRGDCVVEALHSANGTNHSAAYQCNNRSAMKQFKTETYNPIFFAT